MTTGSNPRHRWNSIDVRRLPACETGDGNDRSERDCILCGAVRVTVHPPRGVAWRAWRARGSVVLLKAMPACAGSGEPREVPFS